jgi:hypothetical protein
MTQRPRGSLRSFPTVAWAAVWLVVAGVGVVGHVLSFTQLSHIDEYQHVDYLDRTLQLEHVRGGEQVEELAMREQACRGIDLEGFVLPPCGSELSPELFPGSGYNHTYLDPPTYYAVTGPLAKLVQGVTGLDSLVTAARGVGALWLGTGLLVAFLLARRLGADVWAAAGATLVLAGSPMVLQAASTVTTDAPLLLTGGLLTLFAVGAVEGRISPWWVAVGGGAAMAVKTTSVTVVGMVALFLLVRAVRERRAGSESSPAAKSLLLLVCGSAAASVPWAIFNRATALPSAEEIPAFQGYKTESIGWLELSRSFNDMVPPISGSAMRFMQTPSIDLLLAVVGVLIIAATTGLAWFGAREDPATSLAASLVTAMVLGGPVLVALFFVGEQMSVTVPPRYGLSLLPGVAACVAVAASRRSYGGPALVLLGVLGLAAFGAACL